MLIRVHPGEGLVARAGGSVLVLLPPVPDPPSIADELLSLVMGSAGAAVPGRRLAQQVARLVAGAEPADVPSFGLVAQADDGLVLMLHGDADADVSRPAGEEHLSGRQVATWVDRILEQPLDLLTVRPTGKPFETPDSRVRLHGGVVHGGGLSVVPARVADSVLPVDRDGDALVPLPPMDAMPTDDTEVVPPPRGRPTMESPAEALTSGSFQSVLPEEAGPGEVLQELPGAGGEPDAGAQLVEGPPPPLVMVFDDGTSFTIDGEYVLGREPASDPDVVSGQARPLVVDDPGRTVSRVHAAIAVDGGNVLLTDRGAANGTYVATPGKEDWAPLLPNKPTMIEVGTRVRLGDREFRFTSVPAEQ